MSERQDALIEIGDIVRRHQLTLDDLATVFQVTAETKAAKSNSVLTRVFGYLGGILVFAGLCIFGHTVWNDIGASGRILITLGSGFCAFIMAIVCTTDDRYEKAATPLFLIAAFLQASGIMVVMKEFSRGGDPAHGVLFMSFVMLVQQGLTFAAKKRTVLALTSIFFGLSFFGVAFDLLHISHRLNSLVLGLSLMCLAWALDKSRHKAIAPLCYFFGSLGVLGVAYDMLHRKPFEILFLGLSCGMVFLSTVARSRTLLLTSTLATLSYIGYFSEKYFADTLGWPILLMLLGFVLIGVSALAVKINNKYIKGQVSM